MSIFKKVIIKGMKCPYCNSENIIVIAEELMDGRQIFQCVCKTCNEFWRGEANKMTGGHEKHIDGEIL